MPESTSTSFPTAYCRLPTADCRLPTAGQLARAIEPCFVLEDWHSFGPDYDRTLMAWWRNFDAAWPQLRGEGYDQRFYRMWKYYLHSCAGFSGPDTGSCGSWS